MLTKEQKSILRKIVKSNTPGALVVQGKTLFIKPEEIRNAKTGGLLPLAMLIPLIAGAVGAAGGVAGGVAKAVEAGNTSAHQKKMEAIAMKKGVRIGKGNGSPTDEVKLAHQVLKNAGYELIFI